MWFGALFIRIYGLLQSLWWFSTLQPFLYSIRKVSGSRCTTPISFSCPDWLDYLYARMFQYNNYYCANKLKRPLYWEGKQNQLTTTFHFVLLSSQRKKARRPPPLHALLHNERFSKLYNVSSSFGSFGQRYLVAASKWGHSMQGPASLVVNRRHLCREATGVRWLESQFFHIFWWKRELFSQVDSFFIVDSSGGGGPTLAGLLWCGFYHWKSIRRIADFLLSARFTT